MTSFANSVVANANLFSRSAQNQLKLGQNGQAGRQERHHVRRRRPTLRRTVGAPESPYRSPARSPQARRQVCRAGASCSGRARAPSCATLRRGRAWGRAWGRDDRRLRRPDWHRAGDRAGPGKPGWETPMWGTDRRRGARIAAAAREPAWQRSRDGGSCGGSRGRRALCEAKRLVGLAETIAGLYCRSAHQHGRRRLGRRPNRPWSARLAAASTAWWSGWWLPPPPLPPRTSATLSLRAAAGGMAGGWQPSGCERELGLFQAHLDTTSKEGIVNWVNLPACWQTWGPGLLDQTNLSCPSTSFVRYEARGLRLRVVAGRAGYRATHCNRPAGPARRGPL